MVDGIWGQTQSWDDRTLGPVDLTKRRPGGPSWPWLPDMGTDTEFPDLGTDTMSDIPVRNVQRETFNSQLLTG